VAFISGRDLFHVVREWFGARERAGKERIVKIRELVDGRPFGMYIHCISGGRMVTKIQKWGNSLGLRIPKSFAAEAKVEDGSTVDISVVNGGLVVRPMRRRRYVLGELLKGIRPDNLHEEVSTGERVGVEAW
jgi:antitoxin MazE